MAYVVKLRHVADSDRINLIKSARSILQIGLWEARCVIEAGIVCPFMDGVPAAGAALGQIWINAALSGVPYMDIAQVDIPARQVAPLGLSAANISY